MAPQADRIKAVQKLSLKRSQIGGQLVHRSVRTQIYDRLGIVAALAKSNAVQRYLPVAPAALAAQIVILEQL